jgi:hypothetical protein
MAAIQWVSHSMSHSFQSQTISSFVNEFYRVFCGCCIYLTPQFLGSRLGVVFFRAMSLEMRYLGFSLKFYTLRTLIRNVNNVVCVSASHAVSLDITICIPCLFTLCISALWRCSVEYYIKTSYFKIWSAIELIWRFNSRLLLANQRS